MSSFGRRQDGPEDTPATSPELPLRFVVQKHDASHLHYDFRLEIDGVLKSWAVPKGPSLDPSVKRLAMMVEDHPFEYRTFEGVIPKGNYGAGEVIVWDEGTYASPGTESRQAAEKTLREGLRRGDLKFRLSGHKLRGDFALVKIRAQEENTWLLMKKVDEHSTTDDVTRLDRSVVTGRTIDDLRKEDDGLGSGKPTATAEQLLAEAPSAPAPEGVLPMLATLVAEPFDDPGWIFEIKQDGFRTIAEVSPDAVRLRSRNNLLLNQKFPAIAEALAEGCPEGIYDGEVVILDDSGRSRFQLLQNYQQTGTGNLVYFIFDLIHSQGRDLRFLPLLRRKEILRAILPPHPLLKYNDHIAGSGTAFFQLARENELEGIVAKRAESRYLAGKRSREWLKIKIQNRQEAIICGFTPPRGSRKLFGTLILGAYEEGKLTWIGHSGGGFDDRSLENIHRLLTDHVRPTCPFASLPPVSRSATWVDPVVVCEVAFSEWTGDGVMRQPVFLGLRQDKDAQTVVRELVAPSPPAMPAPHPAGDFMVAGRKLALSNLDKVLWPGEGYTKRDLIDYYRNVSRLMLPHLKDRPESLYRTPNGIGEPGFFQKDIDYVPEWATTHRVHSDSEERDVNYFVCQDEAGLVYLANLGCIEINPWLSRLPHLDYPDYFVIDLDPEDIPFAKVVEAARAVREILDQAGAVSFPKTSGATGIHIYVPLEARYDFDTATAFARIIATLTHNLVPGFTSIERSPSKRQKMVYLDYLQNRRGQTLAAPYSVRPRPQAPVSIPLTWDEVREGLDPLQFTMKNVLHRLESKGDLFQGVLGQGVDIGACLDRLKT